MSHSDTSLDALQDIRRMMQRSNRFLSLSGFSGIAAGFWGLAGAFLAQRWIAAHHSGYVQAGAGNADFGQLKWRLVLLAGGILLAALLSAYYFTWRRASKSGMPLWDRASRLMVGSMLVPLVAGGLFMAILLMQSDEWRLLVPLSLLFYGLALVSSSKYTVSDIRYLGYCEIILGLLSTQFAGYGLYFWAVGFGLLHIVYGTIMWWKYERNSEGAAPAKGLSQ